MKKIIAFNWKMNPQSLKEAQSLAQNYAKLSRKDTEIVIIPPFVYLLELLKIKNLKLKIGSQNIFWLNEGAYTGEISPKMLKNLGVEYVIIGHSERRQFLGETDEMINKKVLAALSAGLKVILCVGENYSVRKKGKKVVENYIRSQIEKDLLGLTKSHKLKAKSLLVAYEPLWAIGTGKNATPEYAVEMSKFIKSLVVGRWSLVAKVLYGGSVNSKNISDFMNQSEIDGVLVGGASVNKKELNKILNQRKTLLYSTPR